MRASTETGRRSAADRPGPRPNAAPGRDVGGVVQPDVDPGRGDRGGQRVPARPTAEQRRRAERRGRVPRRERARDRAVQARGGTRCRRSRPGRTRRNSDLTAPFVSSDSAPIATANRAANPTSPPASERDRAHRTRATAGCGRPRSTAGTRLRRRAGYGCGRRRGRLPRRIAAISGRIDAASMLRR